MRYSKNYRELIKKSGAEAEVVQKILCGGSPDSIYNHIFYDIACVSTFLVRIKPEYVPE